MTVFLVILTSVVAYLGWIVLDLQIRLQAYRSEVDILVSNVVDDDDDPDPGEDAVETYPENVVAISRRVA